MHFGVSRTMYTHQCETNCRNLHRCEQQGLNDASSIAANSCTCCDATGIAANSSKSKFKHGSEQLPMLRCLRTAGSICCQRHRSVSNVSLASGNRGQSNVIQIWALIHMPGNSCGDCRSIPANSRINSRQRRPCFLNLMPAASLRKAGSTFSHCM